jgi:quinol monooxygenase YgiN
VPSMPWTAISAIDCDDEYVVVATRFVVTRRHHIPVILAATQSLWAELQAADGLLGYALRGSLTRGSLATLSAWRDVAALKEFVRGEQHTRVAANSRPWLRDVAVATWTASGAELPPDWSVANGHLDTARARPHGPASES